MFAGVLLTIISGVCNGLFTAPMKLIRGWKWENIWAVFIVIACLVMPVALTFGMSGSAVQQVLSTAPSRAVGAALLFGFLWGFGAILFGLSVDRLGVSLANSLVIGLSSALGSAVPLILQPDLQFNQKVGLLLAGVVTFIAGVIICGLAGRRRAGPELTESGGSTSIAYLFCIGSGVMSAIFNIGYTLALPIADTGVSRGLSSFAATNVIWLLMLGAGAIPNLAYCGWLASRNQSLPLFASAGAGGGWMLSAVMGLLWGGSIFLYGAATPKLGKLGPSVGWPLSLAVGLLVANMSGLLLGEWRGQPVVAQKLMRAGILVLLVAIALCTWSAKL